VRQHRNVAMSSSLKSSSYQNKTLKTLMNCGKSTATTNLDTVFKREYGDKRVTRTSPNFSSKLGG